VRRSPARREERVEAQSRLDEAIANAALVEDAKSGLAGFFAREDVRLDDERAANARLLALAKRAVAQADGAGTFVEVVVMQLAVFAARHAHLDPEAQVSGERAKQAFRVVREKKDRGAKYSGEVEALRAAAGSSFASRLGDFGRVLARGELGADIVPSKTPREPIPDPWIDAVFKALDEVAEPRLLYLAHVELDEPSRRDGAIAAASRAKREGREGKKYVIEPCESASAIARAIRCGEGYLPKCSRLRAGAHVSTALLVAEHIGALSEDEAEHDVIEKRVAARIKSSAREFRRALQKVELDVVPKYLVPPLSAREKDEEASKVDDVIDVDCCGGAATVDGVRSRCVRGAVSGSSTRHRSASWARCSFCGLPMLRDKKVAG